MNAVPMVTVAVLERPTFDNERIASFRQWMDDNSNTLARYWRDQGQALGLTEEDNSDFDFWLITQWDIEKLYIKARQEGRL